MPPNNLKTRSDAISAKLSSLPDKPATIDWSYYRSAVAKAGMVDESEKKFSVLNVPEPVDTQTALINTQEAEVLDKFKNMIPFDQMTEGLNQTFPETKGNILTGHTNP